MKASLTTHRQTVFQVVKGSCDHPTARQVFERALQHAPRLSFATVYNSLKYLTDNGYLHQVSFGEESVRYDATISQHDHLICRKCHQVVDIFNLTKLQAGKDFTTPSGFQVEDISIQIFGLCEACQ